MVVSARQDVVTRTLLLESMGGKGWRKDGGDGKAELGKNIDLRSFRAWENLALSSAIDANPVLVVM